MIFWPGRYVRQEQPTGVSGDQLFRKQMEVIELLAEQNKLLREKNEIFAGMLLEVVEPDEAALREKGCN